jgi:hypothetical protein
MINVIGSQIVSCTGVSVLSPLSFFTVEMQRNPKFGTIAMGIVDCRAMLDRMTQTVRSREISTTVWIELFRFIRNVVTVGTSLALSRIL